MYTISLSPYAVALPSGKLFIEKYVGFMGLRKDLACANDWFTKHMAGKIQPSKETPVTDEPETVTNHDFTHIPLQGNVSTCKDLVPIGKVITHERLDSEDVPTLSNQLGDDEALGLKYLKMTPKELRRRLRSKIHPDKFGGVSPYPDLQDIIDFIPNQDLVCIHVALDWETGAELFTMDMSAIVYGMRKMDTVSQSVQYGLSGVILAGYRKNDFDGVYDTMKAMGMSV